MQVFFYFSESSSNKKFLNDSITKVVKYVFNLPGELSGITGQLQTVIDELESSYNALQNITGSEYYVEGLAQGQVGLFSIVTVRMEELISHYSRLQEYVTYAGETFVELDRSVSSDIKSKGK